MNYEEECCDKCGSRDIKETPTKIEYDDGTVEINHDTLDAKCNNCGKEWIIVYM